MGKGSNPMQEHHRKKRQKEIQRNKQQRIKARDERVVETKTVASVQEEIRNLRRRKNLQPTEQQKLQRLEKELKLVKAAAAASNQNKNHSQQQSQRQASQLAAQHELDDPRKSVYYDEKFNPFGAPPPGKPRLYHQRGGGVTMNIKLATVPGEEPPPRINPPAPPPRAQQSRMDENRPESRSRPRDHRSSPSQTQKIPISPPKMKEASAYDAIRVQEQEDNAEAPEKKPLALPTLPAPSKAVMRSRRGKASVDIWASTEEVEYERVANKIDLEADDIGATAHQKLKKKKAKPKKPPLEFHYQDRSGQIQGPFQKAQIQDWLAAGYFPPTTLAKTNRNPQWLPMGEIPALQPETPKNRTREEGEQDQSLSDRILALKESKNSENGDSSIEDRISALKQNRTSVEDRIAALKNPSHAGERKQAEVFSEDSQVQVSPAVEQLPTVPPPPPPRAQTVAMPAPYHSEEDYQQSGVYEVASSVPAYPMPDEVTHFREEDEGVAGPQPPAYPIYEAEETLAYPQPSPDGDDHEIPMYPVGDDDIAVAPYPVNEEIQDLQHPSDTAYPVDTETSAYPVTDSYPVIDAYPTVDEVNDAEYGSAPQTGLGAANPQSTTLKKVKVSKEVVAFLPSHLRSRKRKPPLQSKTEPKRKKEIKEVDDDYSKLMEEVESIGG